MKKSWELIPDDYIPFLKPEVGCITVPTILGSKASYNEGFGKEATVVEPIITKIEDLEKIHIPLDENEIITVEEEEIVVEDVPFIVIEEVPVFPGCTGSNKELRACFSDQISKFILNKFNAELASDIGLQPGSIQRIFVVFKIDNKGDITNINARAPHKKLKEEAIRVIELLPKMIPGKQRGRPVGVNYGLPIVFKVE